MSKVLILLLIGFSVCLEAKEQSTSVRGSITCYGKAKGGLRIELFDEDIGSSGDHMGDTVTDERGFYSVTGFASDTIGSIDPVVKIYYRCRFKKKCYQFKVPKQYLTDGKVSKKIFEASPVELSAVKPNCKTP